MKTSSPIKWVILIVLHLLQVVLTVGGLIFLIFLRLSERVKVLIDDIGGDQ